MYVVGPENGHPVKIGYAKNAEARLSGLQVSRPDKLYVWEVFWLRTKEDAALVERHCHQFLKGQNKMLRGEWFSIRAEEAVRVVEACIKALKIDLPGTREDDQEDFLLRCDMRYDARDMRKIYGDRPNRAIKRLAKLGKICL